MTSLCSNKYNLNDFQEIAEIEIKIKRNYKLYKKGY